MMKRNRNRKRTKRTGAKRRHISGRAYDTGHGGSKATSKWQWAHKDLTVTTQQIQVLLTAARASGRKDGCQLRLTGIEQEYWMGTVIGRLGGYGFRGTVSADDGSNQNRGEIGAGYVNLRTRTKEKSAEEGGTRRGKIHLKPSGTSGLCLGITQHPCDKIHAVFVRQTSAAESCKRMGR